ncbi:MAG: cytochrome c3 family protein [bacterium]|nr:MAG: cytochrome c3 family protein [bacterium]
MKYLSISILFLLILLGVYSNLLAQTSCINCHLQLDDQLKTNLTNDSHAKNGISCEGCHGGDADLQFEEDMEASMDANKGYIGIPKRSDIPKFCGRCHSDAAYMRGFNPNLAVDQYQQYLTSQHGLKLAEGDTKVAVCTDCHGIHNIQPANNSASKVFPNNIPEMCGKCHSDAKYMKSYGIPINQQELYKTSAHGINLFENGDRSSPVCNDCHGNHGAMPPGIASISHVCGICHLSQAEMFEKSPHKQAFAEMDLPQCESCHGSHDVKPTHLDMLGIGSQSLCVDCHDEDSEGYTIAQKMRGLEVDLVSKINLADSLLIKAEKAGVEVSEGKFTLTDAENALTKARSVVHYFSLEKFNEVVEPGFEVANRAVDAGKLALKEVQSRRRWLAIISIIIFLAAISLHFKIKMVKKEHAV